MSGATVRVLRAFTWNGVRRIVGAPLYLEADVARALALAGRVAIVPAAEADAVWNAAEKRRQRR